MTWRYHNVLQTQLQFGIFGNLDGDLAVGVEAVFHVMTLARLGQDRAVGDTKVLITLADIRRCDHTIDDFNPLDEGRDRYTLLIPTVSYREFAQPPPENRPMLKLYYHPSPLSPRRVLITLIEKRFPTN